jgi:translation initiation factor IF-3
VVFRGREIAHIDEGRRLIDNVVKSLEDISKVESPPQQQGKRITCVVVPK